MLESLGLTFEVKAASVDESILPGETPEQYVLRVSAEKAETIAESQPLLWVVSADTAVVVGSEVLGKPTDDTSAFDMLKRLNGTSHRVLTGFCIVSEKSGVEVQKVCQTEVFFNDLSDAALLSYIQTGDPLDKAGAYGIQSFGGVLVNKVIGSYTNVVGLPLAELTNELLAHEIITPVP